MPALPQFSRADGSAFQERDGVPQFNQGDAAWASQSLGVGASAHSIQQRGCAVTSMAMALSAVSGQTVTPQALDQHLDAVSGYSGDNLKWNSAAGAVPGNVNISRQNGVTQTSVADTLNHGGVVVLGVRHPNQNTGTSHWIAVTGRNPDGTFRANDPDGGGRLNLRVNADGTFSEQMGANQTPNAKHPYASSGAFTTVRP